MGQPTASTEQATVLYDEDCDFCKWSLDKILAWDRNARLRGVAIQSEEGQALLRQVPDQLRLDSWHLADSAGEVSSAGAAVAPLMSVLPLGRPLAAVARTFPRGTERAYRTVAGNRDRIAKWLRIDASCQVRRRSSP